MNTKERILDAALTLFATKGYGEVHVGEIADAVGIRAPSLYKHFRNKQQIFDALIEDMAARCAEVARKIGVDGADASGRVSEDSLVETGRGLFLYFLHDSRISRFRRVLTLEQFKNPELGRLYTRQYFEEPVARHSRLFAQLAESGRVPAGDREVMAVEFYAPIYTMLTLCDRDPSYEAEALRLIEAHIRRFSGVCDRKYTTRQRRSDDMSRIKDLQKQVHRVLDKMADASRRPGAVAHLHGVALAAAMIAKKRGEDAELAAMAGLLHDLYAYKSGSYDDHAHRGADYARKLLEKLEITAPEETEIICSAIWHHDNKADVDAPMDEVLKDADVIHHSLGDPTKEIKAHERERYARLCAEFGLEE